MDEKMVMTVQEAIDKGYKQQRDRQLTENAQDVTEYFLTKQDAIRRAGTRRSDILKEIQKGTKLEIIVAGQAGLIGDLTGDETYSRVVKRAIIERFGEDALQPSLPNN